MLASILILILLIPVAILPLPLKTSFSANELSEMGICLERPRSLQEYETTCPADLPRSSSRSQSCENMKLCEAGIGQSLKFVR